MAVAFAAVQEADPGQGAGAGAEAGVVPAIEVVAGTEMGPRVEHTPGTAVLERGNTADTAADMDHNLQTADNTVGTVAVAADTTVLKSAQ